MAKITQISKWKNPYKEGEVRCYLEFENVTKDKKHWVHLNVLNTRNLEIGMDVEIDELLHFNEHKWRNAYNNGSWEKEKVRIEKVKNYILSKRNDLTIHIVGFGADSNEIIYQHTAEQGSPDLEIRKKSQPVAKIEVSGSDIMRGDDYWIRPDKIDYIQHHYNENIWIILCYQQPEQLVFIKVHASKKYVSVEKEIRGNVERFVIFKKTDSEVVDEKAFLDDLNSW